jgi:acetyl esterase/lipase
MTARESAVIAKILGGLLLLSVLLLLAGCSGPRLLSAITPGHGFVTHAGIAYGDGPRQKLDVHVPVEALIRPAPVVVFFYGGRWQSGSRSGYRFMAEALTTLGAIAVIPDYRLYPEVRFPAFVEDGARALDWARRHIAGYGGDPDSVFVMGHSAGAHIAALLALDPRYLNAVGGGPEWLAGWIGLAGPYDFLPFRQDYLKAIFGPPQRYPLSQPINFAAGAAPPTLLLHGRDDSTVLPANSVHLAQALEQAGTPVTLRLVPAKTHVSLLATLAAPLRFRPNVLPEIGGFIRRHSPAPAIAGGER